MTRRAMIVSAAISSLGMTAQAHDPPQVTTTEFRAAGVPVVLRITPGSQVVSVRLYLLGGTTLVDAATAGIEVLWHRAKELDEASTFRRTGSQSLLEATHDWTVTGFLGIRPDLEETWAAWADRFGQRGVDPAAFDQARGELHINARRRFSDPDRLVHRMAWQNLFAQHPYRFDPWGSVESLDALNHETVDAFAERHLTKSRMQLVVVGDVSREELTALVTASLGGLPRGRRAGRLSNRVRGRETTWNAEGRELPTNYVLGYFVGPQPGDDDYFAFEMATRLLGSLVFQAVRSRRGLSYAANAPFIEGRVPVGGLYASTRDPAVVYRIMRTQMEVVKEFGLGRARWNRFLDQFLLERLAQNMTVDNQATALARAKILFRDLSLADGYVDRLRDVRPYHIRAVARRYFKQLQLAFLGDPGLMQGIW